MIITVKSFLKSGAAAFQFLTRLPVPVAVPFDERTLAVSVVWYPVVGLIVGALLSAVGAIGSLLLPPLAAAVVVVALWLALTGGLHLDGLMDTADGLLSYRSRERMLEIMKDSRVGAMGVMAGCLQLLLKLALLAGWTGETTRLAPWLLLPAATVLSRAFLAAAIAGWPYARADGAGLGSLYRGVTRRHAVSAAALAALVAALLAVAAYGPERWPQAAVAAALLTAAAYAGGLLLAGRIAGKLGGLTGDTYGALNELLETALLLAMAIAIHLDYL